MKKSLLFIIILSICPFASYGQSGVTAPKTRQKTSGAKSASGKPGRSAQSAKPQAAKPAQKEEDCGCEGTAPPDVVAVVNGAKINIKDIDEPIKDRLKDIENQIIQMRKTELDSQVATKLFEQEAARLGMTTSKLFEMEITSKVKQPTEAEARAFYDQNRQRLEGDFASIKGDIMAFLASRQQQELVKQLAGRLAKKGRIQVLVESVAPPKTEAELSRLLATVNGARITLGDVEEALKPVIFEAQEKMYEMRKQVLDTKINNLLLEEEAKKRQVTPQALYDSEIKSRMKPVTVEDAQKLYDDNKGRFTESFDQMKASLTSYIEQQRAKEAESQYADELRKSAAVKVHLAQPDPPTLKIATDDQPSKGPASASVTIVEFTDFECPSCAYTQPILEEVVKGFGEQVRLVVRDFPLDQHMHAFKAAEAAEAAREQGKYWEYTALLFKNQKALEVAQLKEYAEQVGLDRKRFDEALDSGKFADKVKRDLREGEAIGVNSTPTVFINGKRLRDRSAESMKAAIEAALKATAKK